MAQETFALCADNEKVCIDGVGVFDNAVEHIAGCQVNGRRNAACLAEIGGELGKRFMRLGADALHDFCGVLPEQFLQRLDGALLDGVHQGELGACFRRQAKGPVHRVARRRR